MRNRAFAAIGLFCLLTACTALEPLAVREEKYGRASPVFTRSFASKEMDPTDIWKVYLNASDDDGDMQRMIITFGRNEEVGSEITWTRIQEENRRELSGYLYWRPGPNARYSTYGFLTVQVEDRAGHRSNGVSFPIEFKAGVRQEAPPRGAFQEKELGPVMISLRPPGGDGGSNP